MDKYEYNLKLDQMKSLSAEENYAAAAEIADTINWNKVKNVNALVKAGEIYEKIERYEESRDILLMAYDRSPVGRTILYRLTEIAIKMGDFKTATEYYNEFMEIAPHDNLRYTLRYKLKKAQGAEPDELIPILEELNEIEYTEEWAYELAYLYHTAGMTDKCVDACDELILWFGDGAYVERALELKMLYQPLSKSQEEKYRRFRIGKGNSDITIIDGEEMEKAGEYAHDAVGIPPVQVNVSKFNTVNLQEEIAKGIQQIIDATEKETVTDTMDNIKKIVEDIPYLQLQMGDTQRIAVQQKREADAVIDGTLKTDFKEMLDAGEDVTDTFPSRETAAETDQVEGQMSIADVLDDWEKTKQAAEAALWAADQRKLETTKAMALQEAGDLMDRLNDVIPKLDAGVDPKELLKEEYMQRADEDDEDIDFDPFAEQREADDLEIYPVLLGELSEAKEEAAASDQSDSEEHVPTEEELAQIEMQAKREAARNLAPKEDIPLEEILLDEIELEENEEAESPLNNTEEDNIVQEEEQFISEAESEEMPESTEADIEEKLIDREVDTEADMEEKLMNEDVDTEANTEEVLTDEGVGTADKVSVETSMKMEEDTMDIVERIAASLESAERAEELSDSVEETEPEASIDVHEQSDGQMVIQGMEEEIESDEVIEEITQPEEADMQQENLDNEEMLQEGSAQDSSTQASEGEGITIRTLEDLQKALNELESNSMDKTKKMPTLEELLASINTESSADSSGLTDAAGSVNKEPDPPIARMEDIIAQEEAKAEEEQEQERLTDSQKAVFSYFVPVSGMENQLSHALNNISEHLLREESAYTGNLIVQGGKGCGKTVLATSMIRALQKETGRPNNKVGKIKAAALNKKDIQLLLRKVQGGCLIIEQAGDLSKQSAVTLSLLMGQDMSGLLVVLEDTSKGIRKALMLDDGFAKKFTETITVPIFTNDELVAFADSYSKELGYEIDEMAVLALHNRISNIQRLDQETTLTEVKDIVDEAIKREANSGLRKFFGNLTAKRFSADDRIILQEKDFA